MDSPTTSSIRGVGAVNLIHHEDHGQQQPGALPAERVLGSGPSDASSTTPSSHGQAALLATEVGVAEVSNNVNGDGLTAGRAVVEHGDGAASPDSDAFPFRGRRVPARCFNISWAEGVSLLQHRVDDVILRSQRWPHCEESGREAVFSDMR